MRPAFLILADGADVTAQFQDRLVSLTVTDNDGEEADQVEITVDDRRGRVAMPALDARLEVYLGWHGQPLSMMGVFAVDGVSGEGPVETLTISATAADMKGPIRSPKTRAWQDVTLAEIARTIAAEAGLEPVLSPSLAGRAFPYVAQTAESDLHLITRLARLFNATAKPAGGRLIVQRRGEPATAAGDAMPSGAITRADLTGWSWRLETREAVDRVEAEYVAPGEGRRETVSAGSGDSRRRLRHVHADRASALDAAEGELARGKTTAMTCSADLATFRPDIMAGARAVLSGISEKLDGDWQVRKVEHRLEGALLSRIELTKGAVEAAQAEPVVWGEIEGLPEAFPAASHGHAIGDVAGLPEALDGKQPLTDFATINGEAITAGGNIAIPAGRDAIVISFATDAEAEAYSTANPGAAVFSREGL